MKSRNPFKNLKLDAEEREIERAIEAGDVEVVPLTKQEIRRLKAYAKYTLEKIKNINIRLAAGTVHALKTKAIAEGLPYQTLAASVLYKYAMGA